MNNNFEYEDDGFYNVPYTREEQNIMTEACFLEILKVVKIIIHKHFSGKLLSPVMINDMFIPLVTSVMDLQFRDLPKELRNTVYKEMYQDFITRFEQMIFVMCAVDKEIKP